MGEELRYVIQKHEAVLNDDDNKNMLLHILISIGTNWMIYDNANQSSIVAHAIMILERYSLYGETPDYDAVCSNRVIASKYILHQISLDNGISRELLKFFRKRITCECLKKMHLEARKSHQRRACAMVAK